MSDERFGFVIDIDTGVLVFQGGFTVPIVGMIDRFGDETDEKDEAVALMVLMPPEGMVVSLDMHDIVSLETNTIN